MSDTDPKISQSGKEKRDPTRKKLYLTRYAQIITLKEVHCKNGLNRLKSGTFVTTEITLSQCLNSVRNYLNMEKQF